MSRPQHIIFVPTDPSLLIGGFGSRPPHATCRAEVVNAHIEVDDDPTARFSYCDECGEPWPCAEPGVVVSRRPAYWFVGSDSAHAYWNRESAALVLAWDRTHIQIGLFWLGHKAGRQGWAHEVVSTALRGKDDLDALSEHDFPGTLLLLNEKGEVMQSYPSTETP
jgi:hypothetical protein